MAEKYSTRFPKFCPRHCEFLEILILPEVKDFCDKTGLENARHLTLEPSTGELECI